MIGQTHAPAWLETYWLLARFGSELRSSQTGYAVFVAQGVGQAEVWQGLWNQVFPGSDAFVKRHCTPPKPSGHLLGVPRAQSRALAKPLDDFARHYPERHDAMARAYQSGAYTMREIDDLFRCTLRHCKQSRGSTRRKHIASRRSAVAKQTSAGRFHSFTV